MSSWYPSEPDSQVWAYERLARRIAREAGLRGVIPVPGDEDDDQEDMRNKEEDTEVEQGGEVLEEQLGDEVDEDEEKEWEKNLDHLWGDEGEFDSGSGEEWDPKEWGR